MKYNAKVIMSGHIVELYEYEKAIKTGKDCEMDKPAGRRGKRKEGLEWIDEEARQLRDKDKEKNRDDVLRRARQRVRRLVSSNLGAWDEKTKFITLTFRENMQDVKAANYEFKKFRQRLEYHLKVKLEYIAVIEFQQRGAVHYHVLFFNLPYIAHVDLERIWRNGFVKINSVEDPDRVIRYVTKYMTKSNDDERLRGKKCYFTSRGLAKPVEEIIEKEDLDALRVALSPNKTFEKEFPSEYVGMVSYQQYNLKRTRM